jgi:hypothetical protein
MSMSPTALDLNVFVRVTDWTGEFSMPYFIGDEPSSSNFRPGYCNQCDADTPDQCRCDYSSCSTADDYIHHQQRQQQGDVCKECGHDHSYRPDFSDSGVQTSIDIIFSELLVGWEYLKAAKEKEVFD